MAALEKPQKFEPYVAVQGDWSEMVCFPARLASEVLPYIKRLKREYKDGVSTLTEIDKPVEFQMLTTEQMTAIAVATRIS